MAGKSVSVIIPTYNPGKAFIGLIRMLKKCREVKEIIIIDSGSTDGFKNDVIMPGIKLLRVDKSSFDHGKTRTIAGKKAKSRIIVYMTQDAVPAGADSIKKLIKPLIKDRFVAASYGRQLPAAGATPFAAHLRLFNYPAAGRIKSMKDRESMGIKAAFLSNSFAAYRRDILKKTGWFKGGLPMGEDVCAGARMLKAGYKIVYMAEAKVFHSHNYGLLQEFKRYMDAGCFYGKEKWIIEEFGGAESEGMKFIGSEMKYLAGLGKWYLVPVSFVRAAVKYAGYMAGRVKAALKGGTQRINY